MGSESLTSKQLLKNEKIKDKVREIQNKYCGKSVETKLYYAIKETLDAECTTSEGGTDE